jgi:putative transposase
MPRPLRITIPNIPFHILNRGNNRQKTFKDDADFEYFVSLLKRFKRELSFKLYHFCLMPNHTHFVIEPTIEGSLPKIMLKLTLAYTRYFNEKYEGVGHVWQGRYKSSLIDKENYFLWCGLYNELNPVRAGLVKHPKDWRWSSFNFYAFKEIDPLISSLIDTDPYYLELNSDPERRRQIYSDNINKIIEDNYLKYIRNKLDSGILGKPDFIKDMSERFNVGFSKKNGRPKKIQ